MQTQAFIEAVAQEIGQPPLKVGLLFTTIESMRGEVDPSQFITDFFIANLFANRESLNLPSLSPELEEILYSINFREEDNPDNSFIFRILAQVYN